MTKYQEVQAIFVFLLGTVLVLFAMLLGKINAHLYFKNKFRKYFDSKFLDSRYFLNTIKHVVVFNA